MVPGDRGSNPLSLRNQGRPSDRCLCRTKSHPEFAAAVLPGADWRMPGALDGPREAPAAEFNKLLRTKPYSWALQGGARGFKEGNRIRPREYGARQERLSVR